VHGVKDKARRFSNTSASHNVFLPTVEGLGNDVEITVFKEKANNTLVHILSLYSLFIVNIGIYLFFFIATIEQLLAKN